jgi:predicted kinase
LRDQATASLAAGYAAIVDATFLREEERTRVAASAGISDVPFIGLWLEAPGDVLVARLGTRGRNASDADMLVLQQQLKTDTGPIGWHRIDAARDMATYLPTVWALIDPLCDGAPIGRDPQRDLSIHLGAAPRRE